MEFIDPPRGATSAERNRKYRKESSGKYYSTRKRYRHGNSKWQTDAQYLARPFTAWDGEGVTLDDGSHIYTLLSVKTEGDSDTIYDVNGLQSLDILAFVLAFGTRSRGSIHVIYGGNYDFNMWLKDVPHELLDALYEGEYVDWFGYRLAWRSGKSLYLAHVSDEGAITDSLTIYDCASFFQTSFIKACDSYLGDRFYRRDVVVKNKALRSSFTEADAAQVAEYNDIELVNLIRLMNELRERLNKVGLRPRRWDGPGAIAAALLTREGVKEKRAECPPPVAQAARYAYAGGRFEVLKFGSVASSAWEYDINSAYPDALRSVPNLARGKWRHHSSDGEYAPFAVYHLRFTAYRSDVPGPLFVRGTDGSITYPRRGTGWYWSPEVETLREYARLGFGEFEILEVWEFVESDSGDKPFAFIDGLYNKRRALKKGKDGAHVGIKLALNSLYGKLAQQIGARQDRSGNWKIPPFHQLEWAGYTTSYCRAKILRAALSNLEAVIAFETDAVFASAPLDVKLGEGLGEFEEVAFSRLTYAQSGIYFGESLGEEVVKSRGVEVGGMTEKQVITAMRKKRSERYVTTEVTRFVGIGMARRIGWEHWQRWETKTHNIFVEPQKKRLHDEMECSCANFRYSEWQTWHTTMAAFPRVEHSVEFPVIWVEESLREMPELDSWRALPTSWQDDA